MSGTRPEGEAEEVLKAQGYQKVETDDPVEYGTNWGFVIVVCIFLICVTVIWVTELIVKGA